MSTANVAGAAVDTRHWIGGQRVASAAVFTDLSPIDERPLAEVARGAELAAVETADNGALLRSHRASVMPRAAQNFRFFADWLGELDGGDLEIRGHREEVSWAPSGMTAVITPWNAPLMLATWRIAPALAAGNTVVAKPPEWAPLTASLLAAITRTAGLPDGVFNVGQGLGEEAGAPLAAHPDLARVCFTSSVATGRLVAAAAGAQLTPASLELGGKSPLIVFADADLDLAVRHPLRAGGDAVHRRPGAGGARLGPAGGGDAPGRCTTGSTGLRVAGDERIPAGPARRGVRAGGAGRGRADGRGRAPGGRRRSGAPAAVRADQDRGGAPEPLQPGRGVRRPAAST